MSYDRLSAHDAVFLRIEDARQAQHVGSLSIYPAGPWRDHAGRLRIEDLRAFVGGRLHRVPRLRQKVMEVPLGQARPIWVDDEHFDIEYHVRLTALPRPGDRMQLLELMGRVQSLPLDRARPLWELWFVDGLESDHAALIIKTHHALGDGVANVDLGMALLETSAAIPEPDGADDWRPAAAPSSRRLFVDTMIEELSRPFDMVRAGAGAFRSPGRAIGTVSNVGRALASMAVKPEPVSWNTAVSPHRRWRPARVSLDRVKAIKADAGVTVNDVVVAACSCALRRFLTERGETVDGRVLKAMVPVSTRRADEHGETLGNRVSMFVVDLPVGEPDPARQLADIHAQTGALKESGLVEGAHAVIRIADGVTPLAVPLTRYVTRNIPMNLVITNIPGPPVPLWLWGAPLLEVYPYVEVVDNEGLTIAVLSYADELFFGVTSDRDVVPDLGRLCTLLEEAVAEFEPSTG